MAKCKYCRINAWLLRWKHKKCALIHDFNKSKIDRMIYNWFFWSDNFFNIREEVIKIAKESYILPRELDTIYISNYNKIVKQFLYDGIITEQEEIKLTEFKEVFKFDQEFLDQKGLFQKFIKAIIVRDIISGREPDVDLDLDFQLPFNLDEWEKVVRLFDEVELYEKTTKSFNDKDFWDNSSDEDELFFSSTFSNDFVKTKKMKFLKFGTLVITNKNSYFIFDNWSIKINIKNLSSLVPYQDWVWFKPKDNDMSFQVFKNLDWWFAYNIMFNLNR